MKWRQKYNINLEEVYKKHLDGYSLPELSKEFGVPRTTLARYFDASNLIIYN